MKRFLIALIVLVPSLASAQVSPYPLGVSAPIFGLPASAVSGGGGFTGQLFGPASCALPAYSFTASPSTGLGSDAANAWCLSANGVAILRGSSTAVTSTVPVVIANAGGATNLALKNTSSATQANVGLNFQTSNDTVKWQMASNAAIGLGWELNEGESANNRLYVAPGGAATFKSTLAATGALASLGGVTTEGLTGVPVVAKVGRITAQSTNATIATLTTPAVDGSYEVSANMNVTASTTLITTLTCTYTDESNTARTMILPVAALAGSFIAGGAITGAGASVWETPMMHIRVKASTAITILTSAGTFTGVTYTADAVIKQMK